MRRQEEQYNLREPFNNKFTFLCIFLSACFQLYSTWNGIHLTSDSIDYLSATRSFIDMGVMLNAKGEPYSAWPPLFPLFLSAFGGYGVLFSRFANTLFLTITLWIWVRISETFGLDKVSKNFFILALSVSTPLILVHSFLWTEPLFLVLLSLCFYLLTKHREHNDFLRVFILAILSSLMILQRHAGLFFIVGFTLILVLKKTNLKLILLFLFIATLPWLLWISSHLSLSNQHSLMNGLVDNVASHLLVILKWGAPWPWLSVVMILGALFFFALKGRLQFKSNHVALALLPLIYVFFVSSWGVVKPDDYERYMAITYPFLFIIVFLIIDRLKEFYGLNRWVVIILTIVWFSYPSVRLIKNLNAWHSRPRSNNSEVHFFPKPNELNLQRRKAVNI